MLTMSGCPLEAPMFSSQTIVAGSKKVDLSPRAAPPGNWLKEDLQEARDLLNALPKTAKGAIARGKALPEREPIGESERTVFLARMCFCIFAGTAFLPGPARSAEGFIRGDVDGSLR